MNESPVRPLPLVEEQPVLDSNLFLLHRSNQAFVERRSNYPNLGLSLTSREKILTGAFAVCLIFIAIASSILPPSLAIFGVLGLIGGFLGVIERYGYPSNDTIDLAGWIVPGVVLHSKKIRVREGNYRSEQVGIRYQFTTPKGVVMEGYSEGESNAASDKMAPPPGTPVRVWYDDAGNHYLL